MASFFDEPWGNNNNKKNFVASRETRSDFQHPQVPSKMQDIWMRDPFIVPEPANPQTGKEARYVLFGTTDRPPDGAINPFGEHDATGFDCYESRNLIDWFGPYPAFRPNESFWADTQFWAPEVFHYCGRFVMVASFKYKGNDTTRAVQALESDTLTGPYHPICQENSQPLTPPDWDCLDGTLYIERTSGFTQPHPNTSHTTSQTYLIFCHEFTQIGDGEICAIPVSNDLSTSISAPQTLMRASEAPWVGKLTGHGGFDVCHVTDGPVLYRSPLNGELLLLWSSFDKEKRYRVGVCRSTSGSIKGPWIHDEEPLLGDSFDGGHCMLFRTHNEGHLLMALHSPNKDVWASRPRIMPVFEILSSDGKTHLVVDDAVLSCC